MVFSRLHIARAGVSITCYSTFHFPMSCRMGFHTMTTSVCEESRAHSSLPSTFLSFSSWKLSTFSFEQNFHFEFLLSLLSVAGPLKRRLRIADRLWRKKVQGKIYSVKFVALCSQSLTFGSEKSQIEKRKLRKLMIRFGKVSNSQENRSPTDPTATRSSVPGRSSHTEASVCVWVQGVKEKRKFSDVKRPSVRKFSTCKCARKIRGNPFFHSAEDFEKIPFIAKEALELCQKTRIWKRIFTSKVKFSEKENPREVNFSYWFLLHFSSRHKRKVLGRLCIVFEIGGTIERLISRRNNGWRIIFSFSCSFACKRSENCSDNLFRFVVCVSAKAGKGFHSAWSQFAM